jgi:tetratricopeptide (TPR) repeat protein
LHVRRKNYVDALRDFDRLVQENSRFRPAYLIRAQVHFLRGDDSRGLADLTTFLDLGRPAPFDPKNPRLFAVRGRLLLHLVPRWGLSRDDLQAKWRLTWNELEAAKNQGCNTPELFDALGSTAEHMGKWDAALANYAEALNKASPELAVKVRTKRGWIYASSLPLPQYDRARGDFTEAVRLDPNHADAHGGLGFVYARAHAPSEALREAAMALWHEADNYVVLHNAACIYAELSRVDSTQATAHQDTAMDLLRRAVVLCRRAGDGATESRNIQLDPSLQVLSTRVDFPKLIAGEE